MSPAELRDMITRDRKHAFDHEVDLAPTALKHRSTKLIVERCAVRVEPFDDTSVETCHRERVVDRTRAIAHAGIAVHDAIRRAETTGICLA